MTRPAVAVLTFVVLLGGSLSPGPVAATDPTPSGAIVTGSGRVLPPLPPDLSTPSVHAEMLAAEADADMGFTPGGEPTIALDGGGMPTLAAGLSLESTAAETLVQPLTATGLPNGLYKEVFGFLPYWMLTNAALSEMRYDRVSTIAYFSINIKKDGSLVKGDSAGWTGWTSSKMTQVINNAHARGVKVVLTVTMMAWDSTGAGKQRALLTNATARRRAVRQIANAIGSRGADGVNLDFEPLATDLRAPYVRFVKQLKAKLTDAGVGKHLTVCVMAGAATWATGYDVAGLTSSGAANALFVMGYDYHWSGSSRAGGVAPITSPYTIDVDRTMRDFLRETSGSKLIWGVPYYGRTWRTETKRLNSKTLSGGSKSYYYTGHRSQARQYGRRWDDVGKVPWYRYKDATGTWIQGYYDDVDSLSAKYNLINSRGLAGTGMWTLLMDQGRSELWDLLFTKFGHDVTPPAGGIRLLPRTTDSHAVKVRWRAVDPGSGVASYRVQVRPVGGSWSTWISKTTAKSAWYLGTPGTRYEFRVRATDRKGNRQPWVTVPGKPQTVKPGKFAKVTIDNLNIRSGPGTGTTSIGKANTGDIVYVLEGPQSGGDYEWYQVQYGFTEWPSADPSKFGWVAAGSGGDFWLVPAAAPTITKLDPFVRYLSVDPVVSPNADGKADKAVATYQLKGNASNVKLKIVNASGSVKRTIDLGAQSQGMNTASWNGRYGGSRAPEGRYLMRLVATSTDGKPHVGPTSVVNAAILASFGVAVDLTPPTLKAAAPRAGASLVPAARPVVLDFSEPLSEAAVQLTLANGQVVSATSAQANRGRRLIVTPSAPLPPSTRMRVRFVAIRDAAFNAASIPSFTFTTAPGTVYDPARRLILERGSRVAFEIGSGGSLSARLRVELASAVRVDARQRARLPNLPGRWLYMATGRLAGRWVRETGRAHLLGLTESLVYAERRSLRIKAGSHTGLRFDSLGRVTARKAITRATDGSVSVSRRAIINGVPYQRVRSGALSGYWIKESARAFLPGSVARQNFPGSPSVSIAAGTYTGYRYTSNGGVYSKVTAKLTRATTANASAFAVINGRAHYLLANGVFAGTWVRESSAVKIGG